MSLIQFFKNLFNSTRPDFQALIDEGAVLIDVRSPQEYDGGHAKGSKNIPLQKLESRVSSFKNQKVILVCQSGMRAGAAKKMLKSKGIEAYNAGSWRNV